MRYFFELDNGTTQQRDEDGEELESFEAARDAAIEMATSFAEQTPGSGNADIKVAVRDDGEEPVFTVRIQVTVRRP